MFDKESGEGTVTAGNSSQLSDGASVSVLMSREYAESLLTNANEADLDAAAAATREAVSAELRSGVDRAEPGSLNPM